MTIHTTRSWRLSGAFYISNTDQPSGSTSNAVDSYDLDVAVQPNPNGQPFQHLRMMTTRITEHLNSAGCNGQPNWNTAHSEQVRHDQSHVTQYCQPVMANDPSNSNFGGQQSMIQQIDTGSAAGYLNADMNHPTYHDGRYHMQGSMGNGHIPSDLDHNGHLTSSRNRDHIALSDQQSQPVNRLNYFPSRHPHTGHLTQMEPFFLPQHQPSMASYRSDCSTQGYNGPSNWNTSHRLKSSGLYPNFNDFPGPSQFGTIPFSNLPADHHYRHYDYPEHQMQSRQLHMDHLYNPHQNMDRQMHKHHPNPEFGAISSFDSHQASFPRICVDDEELNNIPGFSHQYVAFRGEPITPKHAFNPMLEPHAPQSEQAVPNNANGEVSDDADIVPAVQQPLENVMKVTPRCYLSGLAEVPGSSTANALVVPQENATLRPYKHLRHDVPNAVRLTNIQRNRARQDRRKTELQEDIDANQYGTYKYRQEITPKLEDIAQQLRAHPAVQLHYQRANNEIR